MDVVAGATSIQPSAVGLVTGTTSYVPLATPMKRYMPLPMVTVRYPHTAVASSGAAAGTCASAGRSASTGSQAASGGTSWPSGCRSIATSIHGVTAPLAHLT